MSKSKILVVGEGLLINKLLDGRRVTGQQRFTTTTKRLSSGA
jgi:hypothetical protein